ncbi:MAG: hypothetical protein ACK6DP_09920 [Gemmatimonas sp.]|jgi:hypothetical protein|uniref:hypothetical protein n=1 Tax=Gemmatimonas sp. TaxID=1962908 RepID=UPI00391F2B3D|nr:hypothetical protein [Gemmatimonadota bacterium]
MRQLDCSLHRLGVRALGAAVLLGCADRSAETASVDSALARDLTLASSATPSVAIGDTAVSTAPSALKPAAAPTPAAQPTAQPTAVSRPASRSASAPRRAPTRTPAPTPTVPSPAPLEASIETPASAPTLPAPEPAPSAPARAIAAGVALSGPTNTPICSLANRPGDRFVVSLVAEVRGPDGAMLPPGTPILVEMAPLAADGRFAFRLRGVQLNGVFVPAEGSVQVADATTTERQVSKGGDQGKVITGAIIGGILGRVLGGGTRGAVIGAAGGAAAGTVAAARNTVTERCLSSGALLTATLSAPLVLPPGTP